MPSSWVCTNCNMRNEGNLKNCKRCHAARPEESPKRKKRKVTPTPEAVKVEPMTKEKTPAKKEGPPPPKIQ